MKLGDFSHKQELEDASSSSTVNLTVIDNDGASVLSGMKIYPNPFRTCTEIEYEINTYEKCKNKKDWFWEGRITRA